MLQCGEHMDTEKDQAKLVEMKLPSARIFSSRNERSVATGKLFTWNRVNLVPTRPKHILVERKPLLRKYRLGVSKTRATVPEGPRSPVNARLSLPSQPVSALGSASVTRLGSGGQGNMFLRCSQTSYGKYMKNTLKLISCRHYLAFASVSAFTPLTTLWG